MSGSETKKRARPSWKDLPAFLDSSASVSATTFGARRLPEIKALWKRVERKNNNTPKFSFSIEEYKSGGGKTSSRQLRRRTTSHRPRRRHRFPTPQPTHVVSTGDKSSTRRARRKTALLRRRHEIWQNDKAVMWMATHLWHAKRFHMHDNLFGWRVPLAHNNRGAGAALRLVREGRTLLQDVTWCMQPLLVQSKNLKTLCESIQRICPMFLPQDKAGAILSSNSMGEGMIHEVDAFPNGAIGEVTWWINRNSLDESCPSRNGGWFAHLFVHAAMMTVVEGVLRALADQTPGLVGPSKLIHGVACFQLRGANATQSLARALRPLVAQTHSALLQSGEKDEDSGLAWDFNKVSSLQDLHSSLPHLSCIPVDVDLPSLAKHASRECSKSNSLAMGYIEAFQERVSREGITGTAAWNYSITNNSILLVSRSPRDPDLPINHGTCGWDIFCSRSIAREAYVALTEAGNSSAIGLVEAALIRTENDPPLPVFPRDYPDTHDGICYWGDTNNGWSLIRRYLEGGLGRITIPRRLEATSPLPKIDWTCLIEKDPNVSSPDRAFVVRGNFGKPIVDVLAGSGRIEIGTSDGKRRRRRRRPSRATATAVPTVALNDTDKDAHRSTCTTLLQALSLPVILRCRLSVIGKGRLMPGCFIVSLHPPEEQSEKYTLGMTTAGGFSPCRGSVHGIGFVGAARLLRVLKSSHGSRSTVSVEVPSGERQIRLKVGLLSPGTLGPETNMRVIASMALDL